MEPQYQVGDAVKYNGRQGRVTKVFKESNLPKIVWRYYILMRDGEWSAAESTIEKLVKRGNDEDKQGTGIETSEA